jgi:hypothetical protein
MQGFFHTYDYAIRVWHLMSDLNRVCRAAGTGQSDDGRQQMENENGQVTHRTIL